MHGLSKNLAAVRSQRGLSQEQAAIMIGYDRSMISRIERYYAKHLPLTKLVQIAYLYKTSLTELLDIDAKTCDTRYNHIKIVIVEDTITQSLIYKQILEKSLPEIEINLFADAESAMTWLSRHTATLIIVDLNLPGINGDTMLKQLKTSKLNKYTTSILMTDKVSPLLARDIANKENALFFNKHETHQDFVRLVVDVLRII